MQSQACDDAGQGTLSERALRGARECGPAMVQLVAELEQGVEYGVAKRAVLLGRTAEQADALLAGEALPIDSLDALWSARYGLRQP